MNLPWRQATCFWLILVVLWVGIHEALLLGLRRIDSGSFGVWNKAMGGRINAQVLICGSSRAREHYDPSIIGPALGKTAFNIGRDGTLPDLQLAFLRAYLRHNRKPELIIQNLDLTSLKRSRGIYTPGQYLPYLGEPDLFQSLSAIDPSIWKSKYIPLYGFNADDMRFTAVQAFFGLLGMPLADNEPLGFLPMHRRWTHDFDRFKALNPEGTVASHDPQAIEVLNQLADLCKADGIKLIFVYSPEYFENYRIILNRRAIISEYRDLATRYHVPFLDYSDSPITHDEKYFYNSQHLNAEGARLFSLDLASKLKTSKCASLAGG